ncbi:MAG: excinuclease ABC subunit UvrC [Campylobacterota bacterium]
MSLKQSLQNLPAAPGVYQYFDAHDRLLYVGKAKVLKNRVKSYFRFTPTLRPDPGSGPRIYKMLTEVTRLDYIVVDSEEDALILENSLIKQLKPKYNILLRDDKTYPYIYIDYNETFPRPQITRKVIGGKKTAYFGPFPTGARDIVDTVYENFALVQKKNCLKGGKACLFYQMQKCHAPCEGKITQAEYAKIVEEAIKHIKKPGLLLQLLQERMHQLAGEERFEEAITMRQRLQKIESITTVKSNIDMAKPVDYDIFAVDADNQRGVVVKIFMREGKIVSSSYSYFNHGENFEKEQAYRQALIEYYSKDVAVMGSEVILANRINKSDLEEFLRGRFGKKIPVVCPQKGSKKKLAQMAATNAKELLKKDKPQKQQVLAGIKELFDLQRTPCRIEAFDNSHMGGSAPVGAQIVYEQDGFDKASYKRYHLHARDEYHQMEEMLQRRISRFDEIPAGDLWVLDGGDTLVKLAKSLLRQIGVNLDVVGIAKEKVDAKARRAKGSANDILYTDSEAIRLPPTDKRLQLLQRLRDEAHRFAITFHKNAKRKEDKKISMLQIHGIGEAKVKKMLQYFGSFETIKTASQKQLEEVLSPTDAQKVHKFYKN